MDQEWLLLGETPNIALVKNMLFTTLKADFLNGAYSVSHPKETPQEKGGGKVSTAQIQKRKKRKLKM